MQTIYAVVAVLAVSCLQAAHQELKQNTLTEKEKADGWILLFDGRKTKGLDVAGVKAKIEFVEGVLVVSQNTMILTSGSFEKFELRFEYRKVGKGTSEAMWMPLNGSTVQKDDVWNEITVTYKGTAMIRGEEKEPGVGTRKWETELFGPFVAPTQITVVHVFPECKLFLRNIKIKKL
jgi:hypothetical protein